MGTDHRLTLPDAQGRARTGGLINKNIVMARTCDSGSQALCAAHRQSQSICTLGPSEHIDLPGLSAYKVHRPTGTEAICIARSATSHQAGDRRRSSAERMGVKDGSRPAFGIIGPAISMLAGTKDRRKKLHPQARYCGKIHTLSSTSARANGSSQKDLIRSVRSAAGLHDHFLGGAGPLDVDWQMLPRMRYRAGSANLLKNSSNIRPQMPSTA